jgi:hypothetical protein
MWLPACSRMCTPRTICPAPAGASCSLSTSSWNCMSRLNPGGVRMANLESSSSRLMSTISVMASDMVPLFRAAGTVRAAATALCVPRKGYFLRG